VVTPGATKVGEMNKGGGFKLTEAGHKGELVNNWESKAGIKVGVHQRKWGINGGGGVELNN